MALAKQLVVGPPFPSHHHDHHHPRREAREKPRPVVSTLVNGGEVDGFIQDTRNLVEASVQSSLRGHVVAPRALSSDLSPIVSRVFEAGRQNKETFELMCGQLDLNPASIYQSVNRVLENVFTDQVINVGRVVTVLAFGGHLAEYCRRHMLSEVVDSIGPWIVNFFAVRLKSWISERGGWVGVAKELEPQKRQIQEKDSTTLLLLLRIVCAASGIAVTVHLFNVLSGHS